MKIHRLLIKYAVTTHGKAHPLIFERGQDRALLRETTVITHVNRSTVYEMCNDNIWKTTRVVCSKRAVITCENPHPLRCEIALPIIITTIITIIIIIINIVTKHEVIIHANSHSLFF